MIYTIENITDEDITVTLSGDTNYQLLNIPARSSIPVQIPEGYKIFGDLMAFNVTKH